MSSSLQFSSFCQAIAQALSDDGVACDAGRVQQGVRATLHAMGLEGPSATLIQPFLERWVPLLESELGLTAMGAQGERRFHGMPALNARLAQLRGAAARPAAPAQAVRMELDLPSFCQGLSQALAADGRELAAAWLEHSWVTLGTDERAQGVGLRKEQGRWKLELHWLAQHYAAWLAQLAAALGAPGQPGGWLHAWPHTRAKLDQLEQVLHTQLDLSRGQVSGRRGWVGEAIVAAAAGEPAEQVSARVHRARFGLRAVH
ncbi:hypothetical protein [Pseudomonas typographi]|uniref:Uncharacterized protein n=1 Tax=Pseudomonas typographi TaxID=2715964 RepID=A0ABR7Z3I5_9PSED|nr:hypothetical protein [Pseudomonas typographi]MBD1551985.1 hypothetical protein [Pseudomonas typographi]MBD1586549.1 hypothetical protein [Pseudomonas typographi]MBD1600050.1 hypothetical protein [Pseudomonas typographi]